MKPIEFSPEVGPHDLRTVAPKLSGYYYRVGPGLVTIPVITADAPGNGDAGAFLDALPTDERIEFRCVLSQILAGALDRRGFRNETIHVPEFDDVDPDAWVRP